MCPTVSGRLRVTVLSNDEFLKPERRNIRFYLFFCCDRASCIRDVQVCQVLILTDTVTTGNMIGAICAWAGTNNTVVRTMTSIPMKMLHLWRGCGAIVSQHDVLRYSVSRVCSAYTELRTGKTTTALWHHQHHQVAYRFLKNCEAEKKKTCGCGLSWLFAFVSPVYEKYTALLAIQGGGEGGMG